MRTKKSNPRIYEETKNFLLDRQARHLSSSTIGFYDEKLANFCDWIKAKTEVNEVEELTPAVLRKYIIDLEKTHNPGGVHCYWRSIKAFLLWYENEYNPKEWLNPVRKVAAPKFRSDPIEGVPIADVIAMVNVCDPHAFTGIRDIAILRTLVDTGLRRSEFCNMRIMDLNLENGEIKIYNGKGDKPRTVVVGPTARRDIVRYIRRRHSRDPRDFLWVSVSNTVLQPDGLREVLRRRAIQANVEVPSPHDFRRTFALECLRNGMDLVQLMRLMGHTTTTVLQRYLALQTEDLSNAHTYYGPLDHTRHR